MIRGSSTGPSNELLQSYTATSFEKVGSVPKQESRGLFFFSYSPQSGSETQSDKRRGVRHQAPSHPSVRDDKVLLDRNVGAAYIIMVYR